MKKLKDIISNLSTVNPGTWIRLGLLLLSLANAGLNMFGVHTTVLVSDEASEVLSFLFAIIAALAAYWKNNSFTAAAQAADKAMKQIQDEDSGWRK